MVEEEPEPKPSKVKIKRKKFPLVLHKEFINETKNDEKIKNEQIFKEHFFSSNSIIISKSIIY